MNSCKHPTRIGLFGGSFDPPHLGHLALALAGVAAGLDEVWVIPALPVHRQLSGHASPGDRYRWLCAMFADQAQIRVLDWEISREHPTPAIETLQMFRERFPEKAPWLMLGSDAWAGLGTWRGYPAHRQLCNIAVFARKGAPDATACGDPTWHRVDAIAHADSRRSGQWIYISSDLPDISATTIRQYAAGGVSLNGMVSELIRRDVEAAYR